MTNGIFVMHACSLGKEFEVPVYKFVKEALVRRFGEDWYAELEKVAEELEKINPKKINFFLFHVFKILYFTVL